MAEQGAQIFECKICIEEREREDFRVFGCGTQSTLFGLSVRFSLNAPFVGHGCCQLCISRLQERKRNKPTFRQCPHCCAWHEPRVLHVGFTVLPVQQRGNAQAAQTEHIAVDSKGSSNIFDVQHQARSVVGDLQMSVDTPCEGVEQAAQKTESFIATLRENNIVIQVCSASFFMVSFPN